MEYRLGIYLDLPKEWKNIISEIKNKLKPLSKNTTAPHLTLYLCKFKNENIFKAYNVLETIKQEPFSISLDKISGNKKFYFIDVKPKKGTQIFTRKDY